MNLAVSREVSNEGTFPLAPPPLTNSGESDLVFQTKMKNTDREGYLYFLVEHHSSESDPYMPLRFLDYDVRLM